MQQEIKITKPMLDRTARWLYLSFNTDSEAAIGDTMREFEDLPEADQMYWHKKALECIFTIAGTPTIHEPQAT